MPEYKVGDRVEVFDGDLGRWVPGVIESANPEGTKPGGQLAGLLVVKSDSESIDGLRLLYGVLPSNVSSMLRPEA